MDCKIGDGTGGSEIELEGLHTTQECITAVKELYPQANGATMPNPCPDECSCYAEFDMKNSLKVAFFCNNSLVKIPQN